MVIVIHQTNKNKLGVKKISSHDFQTMMTALRWKREGYWKIASQAVATTKKREARHRIINPLRT